MLSGITSWIEDKATGYLKTGIQAGGSMAGNAVGGVGSLVEKAGSTAASSVSGGIGGVGSYISNYGDGIKRSMSADGPVSSGAKKTAVKPGAPAAKPPSAQKALPSSQPAKKALPPAKPNARPQPANTKGINRPVPTTRPLGSTAARSQGPVGVSKAGSSVNSSGKTVISAKSRPKPTAGKTGAARGTSAPAKGGDILGIGSNYADINKTKNSQSKGKSGAANKASAGDPLAMGDLGKKK